MKNLLIIFGLLVFSLSVTGQTAYQESLVEQANQLYNAAEYKEAVSQYESVISSGFESASLYFNLGNAFFKLNEIPSAILFYEKAFKLDPTNEDIRFNLALANSRIIDKMEPLPEFFIKSWWKAARDIYSSNQWAKIGIFFFIAGLLSLLVFIVAPSVFARKLSFWSFLFLTSFMALSFIFSVSSYREYSRQKSGIIFTPTVTVKSSPAETSVDLFVIHEGTKVQITDKVEGWSEVRLANGNVGWIRTDTFRPI